MARNILVLHRWQEAEEYEGWSKDMNPIGSQMKGVHPDDRLYICATQGGELYLMGLLRVKEVKRETSSQLRAKFGEYRAFCRNIGGPFQILALGRRKYQLRFVNTKSDRLDPKVAIAMQVRSHRFLDENSADLLAKLLGGEIAAEERELRFIEGERRAALVQRRVRSAELRTAAKRHWGSNCYCCGFSFAAFYGQAGSDAAIVHHLDPLGNGVASPRHTTVKDVRIVCANCHYMLHLQDPPLDVNALRRQLGRRWTSWSPRGIRAK